MSGMARPARLAAEAALCLCLSVAAGNAAASPCADAAAHLADKFQTGALPPSREADCPLVSALSQAMDLLDERDFPNTQATEEPAAPQDSREALRRALRPASQSRQTRDAACALLLAVAPRSADDASIRHALEISTMLESAPGECSRRLSEAMKPEQSPVFETPSKKVVFPLPVDKVNPQAKRTRTCYYYPSATVEEIDLGEVGADRQFLIPATPHGAPPARDGRPADTAAATEVTWGGYYRGKQGNAFFFDAGDGVNKGMPFAVFSLQGAKLLADSHDGNGFSAVRVDPAGLAVQYRRVWAASCSLYADPAGCWKTIVAQTGLPADARPDCRAAYEAEMARLPKYAASTAKSESVISYEAEAHATAQKTTFAARPGPVRCWLPD